MNARIEINPNICHGNPVIKNTRVFISNILADLVYRSTYSEIIENYPNIIEEDIKAVLDFSSELPQFETIHGIIVIALRQPNAEALMSKREWVLSHLDTFFLE
jgi:uncharacterized protein (DUF433 family)